MNNLNAKNFCYLKGYITIIDTSFIECLSMFVHVQLQNGRIDSIALNIFLSLTMDYPPNITGDLVT